ncbi:MAG TPA: macro domain-containing protein [Dongiaceae bacterium]|jgi:O-acetyl-ADP-ribose deacetylase (regulator of RNase III)|nr:macro domain-containing protein [Dongiaceae bacterium]
MPQAIASRMRVHVGDITALDVDVIVNAANEHLLAGGGVCGAIHRAAGPELEASSRRIGHCPTGGAVLTPGFRLKARHVIHAVGPVWRGGGAGEESLLASCYLTALELAADIEATDVAFPAISTGIFGYPAARAAEVAVATAWAWLGAHPWPRDVIFCCFDPASAELYRKALAGIAEP